jgi:hypothetical protein
MGAGMTVFTKDEIITISELLEGYATVMGIMVDDIPDVPVRVPGTSDTAMLKETISDLLAECEKAATAMQQLVAGLE